MSNKDSIDISSFSDSYSKDDNIKNSKEENNNKKKKKNEKSKQSVYLFRIVWICMIVLVSSLLVKYALAGVNDLLAVDRQNNSVVIEIPKDSGVGDIAKILEDNGVINQSGFFEVYSRLTKASNHFIPGSFEVKTNLDYAALINYIQTNSNRLEKDKLQITFPEGMTIIECAALLEQKEICSAKDFLELCKSDDFDKDYDFISSIKNKDQRYYKLEGYIFPDTYNFYRNEKPNITINRFLNVYDQKIFTKDKQTKKSIQDQIKESGMSMEDVITLASIVQDEAANEDDMYKVASVFKNRLSTISNGGVSPYGDGGMGLLGSDVTVWYPYRSREEAPNGFQSRYDTYKITGLPSGPVCNPGLKAIDAVLNSAKTNYYYFCHDKNKNAYYAKTAAEHEVNLAKAGLK